MKTTVYEKLRNAEQSTAWSRAGAHVIIKDGKYIGKVLFKFPYDGAGCLEVFLWDWSNSTGPVREIQHGTASGYGYDKKSAALSGLKFSEMTFQNNGIEWHDQLRAAGFDVWGVL